MSSQNLTLSPKFQSVTALPKPKRRRKRPPPFSLRLSIEERAELEKRANGEPLAFYIRSRMLADTAASSHRRPRHTQPDQKQLALILAALGRTRLAANMNQLAKAANSGTLDLTPEVQAEIYCACNEIKMIRQVLIAALGIKPED